MSSIGKPLTICVPGAVMILCLAGCAGGGGPFRASAVSPSQLQAYLQDKPARLRPLYRKVLTQGERNVVLNHMQAGLAAMDCGEFGLAERSFDEALLRIESVYADSEKARKARSLWYEEGMKDFRGEPYERAMAYYYRGLLYMRVGDFENARACFKSGVIQDAFAEEKQNRCDFALLLFMEGWASQCSGDRDLAEAAYDEVQRLRPDWSRPDWDDDLLVIAEPGPAPRKLADGVGHAELVYRRGKAAEEQEQRARVIYASVASDMYPMEDVAWQAMTRGGRPVDRILEGQVLFRQKHERVGTALTDVAGTAMMLAPAFSNASSEIQGVSAALGILGVAELALAARAKPRADTRYWDNLPEAVHVRTFKANSPSSRIAVEFVDRDGKVMTRLRRSTQVHFSGRYGLAWVRSRPVLMSVH